MKTIALSGFIALLLAATPSAAQQKSLRDQLVGTWNFVVAEVVAPDGKKSFPFGETPTREAFRSVKTPTEGK